MKVAADIQKIDSNFNVEKPKSSETIVFYDVDEAPFRVYGLLRDNGVYYRLPKAVADSVNEGVANLAIHTAGGRVRFVTDSRKIAIKAQMHNIGKMPHFALTGSAGFDVYIKRGGKDIYYKTFVPPFDITDGYESTIVFDTQENREVTINFPLYSGVKKLFVGLKNGSHLDRAPDYKVEKPVVFYGSSITQGGCASRPGNSYEAIFSRLRDCNYINLGFSGSARGEDEIASYIKGLDMSAFVYDYDHNAPTPEHLKNTHKRMFDSIREANPDLPILMLTRPKWHYTAEEEERIAIVKATYDAAMASGDENVYFLTGRDLIKEEFAETFSVDDCHPNDSGFVSMAMAVAEAFRRMGN